MSAVHPDGDASIARPHVLTRLGLFFVVAGASIDACVSNLVRVRAFESSVAASVLRLLRVAEVQRSFKTYVLVASKQDTLFAGNVTTACSAALPITAVAIATLGIIPGRPLQRLTRFAVTASLIFAVNLVRLVIVLTVGAKLGMQTMAPVHEWVGSLITLVGWSLTLLVLFGLLARQRRVASPP